MMVSGTPNTLSKRRRRRCEMKRTIIVSITLAVLAYAAPGRTAATSHHHEAAHAAAAETASRPHQTMISGRIVAVKRASRIISVQTGPGEIRDVKVPNTATITSHGGSHFSAVRAGQSVHVTAATHSTQGLVAQSVAIP